MKVDPENPETAVLSLPGHERARLAELLLTSLDEVEMNSELKEYWVQEANRRYKEYCDGNMTETTADEAITRARESLESSL